MNSSSEDATYDIIITGVGVSGLSLVFYLLQSCLKDKKILLIGQVEYLRITSPLPTLPFMKGEGKRIFKTGLKKIVY